MTTRQPPSNQLDDDDDHRLAAWAEVEIGWGRRLPHARAGICVPGAHSTSLLKVVVYGVSGFLVVATLAGYLIGLPLVIALVAAAAEVLGCAYLLARLR